MRLNLKLIIIPIATIAMILFFKIGITFAQSQQTVETIVGTVNDPGSGLGPGEFRPPFQCGVKYLGSTYLLHPHWAVDFNRSSGDDYGDPVYAAADGTVILIVPSDGAVFIRHSGGYITVYAHFSKILVNYQDVKAGQKIGEIGKTGNATGPHLHFAECGPNASVGCQVTNITTTQIKFNKVPYPASCEHCSIPVLGIAPIDCHWP